MISNEREIWKLRHRVDCRNDDEKLKVKAGVLRRLLADYDHAQYKERLTEELERLPAQTVETLTAPETPGTYTLVAEEGGRRFVPQPSLQPRDGGIDDRMDEHRRYAESPHFGCDYPCFEIHPAGYRSPRADSYPYPYGVYNPSSDEVDKP